MKKIFTLHSKQKTQTLGLIAVLFLFLSTASGQAVGDYGSANTTGNWTTVSDWVICATAGTWVGATTAVAAPTSATTATVYIRSGHTMTSTSSVSVTRCKVLVIDGTLVLDNTGATVSQTTTISTSVTLNGTLSLKLVAAQSTNLSTITFNASGSSSIINSASTATLSAAVASTITGSTTMNISGLSVSPTYINSTFKSAINLTATSALNITGTLSVGSTTIVSTVTAATVSVNSTGSITSATTDPTLVNVFRITTSLTNTGGTINNGFIGIEPNSASNTFTLTSDNKVSVRYIKPNATGMTIKLDSDIDIIGISNNANQGLGANAKSGTIINILVNKTVSLLANASGNTNGNYIGIATNNALPGSATNFDLNVYGTLNIDNVSTVASNNAIYLMNASGGTSTLHVYNGGIVNLTGNSGIDASKGDTHVGTANIIIDAGGRINQSGTGQLILYSTKSGAVVNLTINGTFDFSSTVAVGGNRNMGGIVNLTMGPNSLFKISNGSFPTNVAITPAPTLDATSLIEFAGTTAATNNSGQVLSYRNVKFSNTGGITFSSGHGNVNISGNLTMATGCGVGTSINTFIMNGSTAQTIDANSNTLPSLTINNSFGVTLLSPVTVSTTLTLTSGKLTLGSNNLSLTNATVTSGISPTSPTTNYIVTNSTGALVWSVASGSTAAYKFPIGSSTAIQTALVDYAGGATTNAGTLAARFIATNPGSTGISTVSDAGITMNAVSPTGYWEILNTGVAGGSYAITVDASGFKQNDNTTAITDFTNIRLIKRATGGSWANSGGTSSAPSGLSAVSISGLSTFSDFGIGGAPGAVLSVDLKNITATAKGNINLLTWSTASEKDNATFQIERSADGTDFQTIGAVKGNGTTNSEKQYSFSDDAPLSMSYYRLRQTDINGTETVSKIISVARGKATLVKVYPSVASTFLTIETAETTDKATLTVTDIVGRMVLQQKVQSSSLTQLDISSLAKGWFVLEIDMAGKKDKVKFIKQ